MQNLDFIVARHSSIVFLFDISGSVFEYYQIIQRTILKSSTREEFIENILKELQSSNIILDVAKASSIRDFKKKFLRPIDTLKRFFKHEYTKKNGWLSTDDNYKFVRSLYLNKKVFHLPLDAADENMNFIHLSMWLKEKKHPLDAFYISNIYEWLTPERKASFIKNINSIIDENTHIIYSVKVHHALKDDYVIYQMISTGKSPYFV